MLRTREPWSPTDAQWAGLTNQGTLTQNGDGEGGACHRGRHMIIFREYHNIAFIVFLPTLAYEPLTVRDPIPYRILNDTTALRL